MNLRLVTIIQIATNYFLRSHSPVIFFKLTFGEKMKNTTLF